MNEDLLLLYCPTCARDSLAEVPPCPDGHGDDCPDRACVDCGTALVLDVRDAQLYATLPGRLVASASTRSVA